MKYHIYPLFFLLVYGCGSPEPPPRTAESFDYEIIGRVEGGEGTVIALIPENSGPAERITAPVRNGVFRLAGTAKQVQPAMLRFEADIVGNALSYSTDMLLLEPGTTEITAAIEQRDSQFFFRHLRIEKGDDNLAFRAFFEKLKPALKDGSRVFGDSIRHDSMVRLVYPAARRGVFDLLEETFASGSQGLNAIILDEVVLSRVNHKGTFNRQLLTTEQKDQLIHFFNALDSTRIDSNKYATMREVVRYIHEAVQPVAFRDLTLYSSGGWLGQLSEKMGNDNYTMLYFWFSGCRPCRSFNQRMRNDYDKLQAKGIGIISINIDGTQDEWLKSSEEDGIAWMNLYSGPNSGLEEKYGISGYPTKIVFDKHLNPVNAYLKEYHDLMNWVESIQ